MCCRLGLWKEVDIVCSGQVGSAHQLPASWQPKEGETNESHTFFYSFLFNFPGFEEQQYPVCSALMNPCVARPGAHVMQVCSVRAATSLR